MKLPLVAGSASKLPGLTSLLCIALFTGIAVYWTMALAAPSVSIAPAGSLVSASGNLNTAYAATLFGRASGAAPIVSAPLPRNIKVLGIAASADRSAAIITVDGGSPQAFGVGTSIDENLKIVSVDPQEVVFEHQGEQIRVPSPVATDASALFSAADGSADTASRADRAPVAGTTPPAGNRPARALRNPAANPYDQRDPGVPPPPPPSSSGRQLATSARPPIPGRQSPPARGPAPTALGQASQSPIPRVQ